MTEQQTGLPEGVATSNQTAHEIPPVTLIPTEAQINAKFLRDGLSPDMIVDVIQGVDDPRIKALAKLAILKVFERFHEDPTGFGLAIPKEEIVMVNKDGQPLYTAAEHCDDGIPAVLVAPPSYFKDAKIRNQLERRYGISSLASSDFIIGYLAAHSTVHRIQSIQHRMDKVEERITDIEVDSSASQKYLELPTEKEAHKVGLETINNIWKELFDFQ